MSNGKRLTEKFKLDILEELCSQLDLPISPTFANDKNKTISAAALDAILRKVAALTGIPPKGLSKEREIIWHLLHKSQESFILSLEIINKVTIPYRIESFCFSFITAWELLMKAKIVNDKGIDKLYEGQKEDFTIGFSKCLKEVFTENTSEFHNLEAIEKLRNEAAHLFINIIPPQIMGIFQAGVKNYDKALQEWFQIDIAKKIPPGMMFLIIDSDLSKFSHEALRKKLSPSSLAYLNKWIDMIEEIITKRIDEKEIVKYFQPVKIELAYVKNPSKADTVLYLGKSGPSVTTVIQPKDPDKDYPFFTNEAIDVLNENGIKITPFHISVVLTQNYNIKQDTKFCYISAKHRRPQFSQAFIDWVIREHNKDSNFLVVERNKYNQSKQNTSLM